MEGDKAKKPAPIGVRIVRAKEPLEAFSVFNNQKVEKSDKSEQISRESAVNASEWIGHNVDMHGLKELVDNSTILPQCIRAYRNNIAGFGISVRYAVDYEEETDEMRAEWAALDRIISILNMDQPTKEVFESVITDREIYGIAYCEVIRDMSGNVVQLDPIIDTPSIDMTHPLEPYMDVDYFFQGEKVTRRKKFRKYRQNVAGKTVYFREFGDPRIMDKRNGRYWEEGEEVPEIDNQANEIISFPLSNTPYGEVRWLGQALTVDGSRRAEILNNNYFRQGRHTPLMILVKGGTLSNDSFDKLRAYMDEIKGESGQHSFLVLETDTNETSTDFTETKQPEIEIKDLASILQKDELFQEYQENSRRKVQSAFLLPDLYVGYTTDFNRATAQTTMEVTEKQVFQPERESLAWIINNKLLNEYAFKYVGVKFDGPDITNPDDLFKMLTVCNNAGGVTPNLAKEVAFEVLGKDGVEDYEGDWGNIPLAVFNAQRAAEQAQAAMQAMNSQKQEEPTDNGEELESESNHQKKQPNKPTEDEMKQLDEQISKAQSNLDAEVVTVMKEVRKALSEMR